MFRQAVGRQDDRELRVAESSQLVAFVLVDLGDRVILLLRIQQVWNRRLHRLVVCRQRPVL
ncbi:hypothetical protein HRbin27_01180 [bacterium HR27]|nr:hypothetical protein HRbin27_01180 [bacterium HR27]